MVHVFWSLLELVYEVIEHFNVGVDDKTVRDSRFG